MDSGTVRPHSPHHSSMRPLAAIGISPGRVGEEHTLLMERSFLMQTGHWCKKPVDARHRYHIVSLIIRLAIGALFVASGALKLLDPAAFAWNIYQYGLVPRPLIDPIAVGLPLLEVLNGAALIANRRWSYASVGGMLVLFMVLLAYAIINGLNVDCGCFGSGEPGPEGLRTSFLRDGLMLLGLAAAWWYGDDRSVPARTDINNSTTSKEEAS